MSIGGRIKSLRKAVKLTQEEFSSRLRISKGFLSNLEKEIRQPSDQLIRLIAFEYYSSEDWLLNGQGDMFLSPAEIIKQQIARLGERAVLDAVREITGGKASIELNDPDLQRMVSYLQKLFAVADEDTRVWARVQFARAFPPDILKEPGPTRNSTDREYVFPSVSSVVSEEASAYLPVLGEAAAGRPIYINEALEGYIPVPERYSRDRHFLLRAKGDSMVGAGIEAGDIVIVRPQPVVDEGDIAVFRIQKVGGAIKYYHRQNGTIILKSANPAYKDIVINPGQDIAVVGKVVSIIKRGDADQRMLTLTE